MIELSRGGVESELRCLQEEPCVEKSAWGRFPPTAYSKVHTQGFTARGWDDEGQRTEGNTQELNGRSIVENAQVRRSWVKSPARLRGTSAGHHLEEESEVF